MAESSNEQSIATGLTFLNNNSTVQDLYEYSKQSSKVNGNEGLADADQQIGGVTLSNSINI